MTDKLNTTHRCSQDLCPICSGAIRDLTPTEKTPGQGNSRTTYKIGDYVIKIVKTGWSSHSDLRTWERIQEDYPEYAEFFVPCLAEGDNWSIQPYIELRDVDEGRNAHKTEFKEAWDELEPIVDELGLSDISYSWNWGLTATGQPVIFDYGL